MTDPYQILGVSEKDNDETIKQAYRELARKYHPDNYKDNPLSELASEKMKEINQAYDQIVDMRKKSGGQSTGIYAQIRASIANRDIESAERLLGTVAINERTAEWYFLMGSVFYKKGWYDEARSNFNTACNQDPSNAEYRRAANQMNNVNGNYRQYRTSGGSSDGLCQCCSSLMCADCMCEMCGGNLCPCIGCR